MSVLTARAFNTTLSVASNLNISHALGMVDLADSRNRDMYTKVHQLMFDTALNANFSALDITSVMVMSGSNLNMIIQNPNTGQWHVLMRNASNTDCVNRYDANITDNLARVDYDTGDLHLV